MVDSIYRVIIAQFEMKRVGVAAPGCLLFVTLAIYSQSAMIIVAIAGLSPTESPDASDIRQSAYTDRVSSFYLRVLEDCTDLIADRQLVLIDSTRLLIPYIYSFCCFQVRPADSSPSSPSTKTHHPSLPAPPRPPITAGKLSRAYSSTSSLYVPG